MESCEICKKEGEDIGLVNCANCSKGVCEGCYHAQGGGAFGRVFPICKECQKVLTACKECGNYIPAEFAKDSVCDDCRDD